MKSFSSMERCLGERKNTIWSCIPMKCNPIFHFIQFGNYSLDACNFRATKHSFHFSAVWFLNIFAHYTTTLFLFTFLHAFFAQSNVLCDSFGIQETKNTFRTCHLVYSLRVLLLSFFVCFFYYSLSLSPIPLAIFPLEILLVIVISSLLRMKTPTSAQLVKSCYWNRFHTISC